MYKPLQIYAPQIRNAKMEIALKYKVKQSKNGKFPSHYKLAQSILKRKFPSVDKPLRI